MTPPHGIELWIAGARIPDGSPGSEDWLGSEVPFALQDLTVSWGRETVVDQPGAATCTVALWCGPTGASTFARFGAVGARVEVYAPHPTIPGTPMVFAGRVTDATVNYDGGAVLSLTCTDYLGGLGNLEVRQIWPKESITARVNRMAVLADAAGVDLQPFTSAQQVAGMDTGGRSLADLLAELATTADCVLRVYATPVAAGSTKYVGRASLEPLQGRAPLRELYLAGDGWVRIRFGAGLANPISACYLERDSMAWQKNSGDVCTRVDVGWVDGTGTAQIATVTDPALERGLGIQRASVTTLLTTSAEAQVYGQRILQRLSDATWRAGGMTWRYVDDQLNAPVTDYEIELAFALLDSEYRSKGMAVVVDDLPAWAPTPLAGYLEGGVYVFTGGAWTLSLTISNTPGVGQSVTWEELPDKATWAWQHWHPSITWLDLWGTRVAPGS